MDNDKLQLFNEHVREFNEHVGALDLKFDATRTDVTNMFEELTSELVYAIINRFQAHFERADTICNIYKDLFENEENKRELRGIEENDFLCELNSKVMDVITKMY